MFTIYDLTTEQYNYLVNGCGPKSKWYTSTLRIFIPSEFEPVCAIHDVGYWIGCTEDDRASYDLILCNSIYNIVDRQSWWNRWYYRMVANIMCNAVIEYGDEVGSFYYGPVKRTLKDLEDEMAVNSGTNI